MLLIRDGCEAAQFGLGLAQPQSSEALGSSVQAWPQPRSQIHYKIQIFYTILVIYEAKLNVRFHSYH